MWRFVHPLAFHDKKKSSTTLTRAHTKWHWQVLPHKGNINWSILYLSWHTHTHVLWLVAETRTQLSDMKPVSNAANVDRLCGGDIRRPPPWQRVGAGWVHSSWSSLSQDTKADRIKCLLCHPEGGNLRVATHIPRERRRRSFCWHLCCPITFHLLIHDTGDKRERQR